MNAWPAGLRTRPAKRCKTALLATGAWVVLVCLHNLPLEAQPLIPDAQDSARRADQPLLAKPSFDVHTVPDGPAGSGLLVELRGDGSVRLGGPRPVEVKAGQLVALRRTATPLPPWPAGEQLIFFNGDRIPGQVLRVTGERVRLRTEIGTELELNVPLTALSVIWFGPPAEVADAAALRRRLAAEARPRDLVLFRNGDVAEGTLTGLDDKAVRLDAEGRETAYERNRVAAVALSTELGRTLRPKGPYVRVVLSNGGRLSLSTVHGDGSGLQGKTLTGAAVRLPLEQVVALDVRQGPAVYLSDLKPKRYQFEPYLGVTWPFVTDGSVAGGDLCLGDSVYDKGIGLHSQCRLTYDLQPGYRWFEARVGLDARTGREGGATVAVFLDGQRCDLGWNGELLGGGEPKFLRVATTGARELTLVVEFGRRGDVQDHVNWAEARLLK